jgi:aspartate/methionine/tyrosine aminotransferase
MIFAVARRVQLAAAIGPQTAAVLLMSPAMPTGAVLGPEHLDAIAGPVNQHQAWVIYDAAMERIRFDGQPVTHPAAHPGLVARTITVGSASKELRMIGWRVGWVVGPLTRITSGGHRLPFPRVRPAGRVSGAWPRPSLAHRARRRGWPAPLRCSRRSR